MALDLKGRHGLLAQPRSNNMNRVLLKPVADKLYQPQSPGDGEHLLFLYTGAAPVSSTLFLDQTWADSGPPQYVGYYLFVDQLPLDFATFEKEVQAMLPDTAVTTEIAWVRVGKPASLFCHATTRLNGDVPVIDNNVIVTLPPGQLALGFADNSVVRLNADGQGNMTGLSITYPHQAAQGIEPASFPPDGIGISLSMMQASGAVGCLSFSAMLAVSDDEDNALKALFNVLIDPLEPFGPRNRRTQTGESFILRKESDRYIISRTD